MTRVEPLTQATVKARIEEATHRRARIVTYPRVYLSLTEGDHNAAMLLWQIQYWWERRSIELNGWFYKSHKDWEEELDLSPYQIREALKILERFGVKTKRRKAKGGAPTLHYSIDEDRFNECLARHLEATFPLGDIPKVKKLDNPEPSQSEDAETSESESEETSQSESGETDHSSYSEITSEITSETTHTMRARAGSRFDLAMCERYARTLSWVKNPEGFAKSIRDSGDDDDKIARWLAAEKRAETEMKSDPMPGVSKPERLAAFLASVRERVNPEAYPQWFAPIDCLSVDGDLIRLSVPNETFGQVIESRYDEVVREAMDEAGLGGRRIEMWPAMSVGSDIREGLAHFAAIERPMMRA